MPLIVNWNGTSIQSSSSQDTWSTKGGVFTSARGITTYFPLPSFYRSAITAVGTYKVPKEYEKRPDLIAKKLYQSEDYWWLVYWMNGVIDPFNGPNANDLVLIADLSQINSLLGQ